MVPKTKVLEVSQKFYNGMIEDHLHINKTLMKVGEGFR